MVFQIITEGNYCHMDKSRLKFKCYQKSNWNFNKGTIVWEFA